MRRSEDRIVYGITVADIQLVAEETLERKLSKKEIKSVEHRIGNYISWYDAIDFAITSSIVSETEK